jgi:hypothetical protein
LSGNSIIEVVPSGHRVKTHTQSCLDKQPDPIDELCQSLFARITEAVMGQTTDDWPRYYDKLGRVVCRSIAPTDLAVEAKALLTRRLMQHIRELENWWPLKTGTARWLQDHENRPVLK